MKSNCYIAAWNKYVRDEAVWLCFRKSKYSKLLGKIPRPIRWVARMLMYPVAAVYAVLHTLAFETWPHFVWSVWPPERGMEYVPDEEKSQRWFPVVFFRGHSRRIDGETNIDLGDRE